MRRTLIVLLLIAAILTGCLPATSTPVPATPSKTEALVPVTQAASGAPWWNETVFYEIFVRSFCDSNGDGIGDFNGIIRKLDYLNDGEPATTSDLGVTGIWLMPIFPSPSYHGYDVTDYYSVNPQYGTMDDFKNLLKATHKRGIHIIMDLPLNHTSDQHPWFKSAKKDVNSPYRDWYIWSNTDPKYLGPWGEQVWYPSLTGYYYGIFESFMPDLNYNNPAVTQEMNKIVTFWLKDVGVDGFRLDAAKHLVEEGTKQENTVSTHKWYINFRPVYKAANPDALTVGELSGDSPQILADYTSGNQLDLAFNFNLATGFISSANTGQASYATSLLSISNKILPKAQYAPFLTNHDQNRTLSQLDGNTDKAKVAASLLLTSSGVPFIYYGEEIGMIGMKPDEDIRRPMQWSTQTNAGFSAGKPWRQPDSGYPQVNVDVETKDPASLLSHYRTLIQLRNDHPALQTGSLTLLSTSNPAVFASLRTGEGETVLIMINLGDQAVRDYSLDLQGISPNVSFIPLLGMEGTKLPASSQPITELPPYSTYIFQIK